MSTNPANSTHRRPKLYQNDIVHVPKVTSGDSYAVVLRCWHEPEDIPPQAALVDPLLRPLQQGEVGISYISHAEGREIINESELVLIDRGLQPGDYCKRSVDDVRSGVVTSVKVRARLAHVISGEAVDGWKVTEDLVEKQGAEVGDYVVYNDWIGQIMEVFDESIIEDTHGALVRLPELGSRLATGDEGINILPPSLTNMSSTIRALFRGPENVGVDRVINVKHTAYAVAWLALNQTLDVADAASRTRPPRCWSGSGISDLVLIRGKADIEMRVGDRVHLKDTTGLPFTEHGNAKDPAGILHVQTFKVKETETKIEVLWQDGIRETLKSTDVIPYVSPDEYDCWPGDHVLWKAESQQRFAVVQSVNPKERTATLLFDDTNTQELVSLLELDPNGTTDASVSYGPFDALGVRRGDFVFIHPEGSTNGMKAPKVPHIGELESWVREIPMIDGKLCGWRKELEQLGTHVAATRGSAEIFDGAIKRPTPGDSSLYWIGEVSELRLDGTVEVTHADYSTQIYPLHRLTRLYDSMDQLEDDPWLDTGSMGDEEHYDDNLGQWVVDEEGQWQEHYDDSGDWLDDSSSVEELHGPNCNCANGVHVDEAERDTESVTPSQVLQDPISQLEELEISELSPESESQEQKTLTLPSPPPTINSPLGDLEGAEEWERFSILPSAPEDHSFYMTVPSQPSKSFLGRLSKEYKALASGLPDSIIVRAYEDRTDLLRSLIIGPENTPYQDAPFVIDWVLDSNFPHSPPLAHFLSWTNGNGRVNPNLYEDGKVCLSILGTWVGDQNETWSAARSSLLQAFVSIQGLVLVKEPWFCEPAYDKLRGTEEAIVNSRLYSEKAYVLSRGFIRRALELPPGTLESEILWLYFVKGRLRKTLQESRELVEKSKEGREISSEDQDLAVPRLTAGGIIALERTLQKLQDYCDRKVMPESNGNG